jgi:two-component system LytT family sensor kinase
MAEPLMTKKITGRSLLLAFGSSWLGYGILQSLILVFSIGLDPFIAIKDSLVTNSLLGMSAYTMINLIRVYQPRQMLRLIDSIGLAVVAMFIMKWLAPYLVDDSAAYLDFVQKSMMIRCFFAWMLISLFAASAALWFYVSEQQEMESRRATSENLAREAELSRLRQQLQPHFLFNSLNSISALAGSKPEEARKMIQQLSDFLRGTLKKDDQQMVLLSEELDHLNLYLEIEKVRFGHRLKTHVEHDEKSLTQKLPSLLLQPIVENAIKFGLYDTTGEIVIRLIASSEDNYLNIKVENPFDPETAKPKQGTGFGLNSVQRRLYLLYARHDLLATSQDDVTFTTQIKIPQTA